MRLVAIYASLLVLALVGAYLSWTSEEADQLTDEIVALEIEREDLREVRYASEALQVKLTPRTDEAGDYVWVETDRVVKKPKTPPPPPEPAAPPPAETSGAEDGEPEPGSTGSEEAKAAADSKSGADAEVPPDSKASDEANAAAEPAPEPETVEEQELKAFKGAMSAEKLVAALVPLRAKRELDAVGEEQLAHLGLADPVATLTVVHGENEQRFAMGDTVFGGDSRYLRDETTGRIFLVDARVLRPLTSAHHAMVDRELFRVKPEDMTRLEVEAGEQRVSLEQRNRADKKAAYWAAVGGEGEHATAAAWIKKIARLRARDYVTAEPAGTEPVLSFTVHSEDADPVRVELVRGTNADGAEAWYGRSDHNRGWVEIYKSQASDAAADVGTLFDAESARADDNAPGDAPSP